MAVKFEDLKQENVNIVVTLESNEPEEAVEELEN